MRRGADRLIWSKCLKRTSFVRVLCILDKTLPRFIVKDASNLTQEFDRLQRRRKSARQKPRPQSSKFRVASEIAERLLVQQEFINNNPESSTDSMAHSLSREYMVEGLRRALEKVENEPTSMLAHSLSHQALIRAISKVVQSKSLTDKKKSSMTMKTTDMDLLSLLLQAQNIIARHQESRLSVSKNSRCKKAKIGSNVKSLFVKSANIEAIEQHEADYRPLQLPPFKPSQGPNLSRYGASCKGKYTRKSLVDKHGTGIGTTVGSLSKIGSKNTVKAAVGWPSPAIHEAAKSWTIKQERQRQQQSALTGREKATLYTPAQEDSSYNDVFSAVLNASLSCLDLVIAITHCSECQDHITLRHSAAKYENEAHYLLHDLVEKCVLWRVPFRVGALKLRRNTGIELQTTRALAKINPSDDNGELIPLLLAKCCSSVPVGSLEVILAVKDEKGSVLFCQTLHSKLVSQRFPSSAVLVGRLRKALAVIMGHDPVVALESFLANKDKLQLSVPICAYPAQCTRGCKPHGAETYFIEDVRDPEEVELYVASSLKSDLSVHPPSKHLLGGRLQLGKQVSLVLDWGTHRRVAGIILGLVSSKAEEKK